MTSNILSMCMCMHNSWQRCHGLLLAPSTTCNQLMQHSAPCNCAAYAHDSCRFCKEQGGRQATNQLKLHAAAASTTISAHIHGQVQTPQNMHNKQHYSPSSRAREGAHRCTRAARQHALLKKIPCQRRSQPLQSTRNNDVLQDEPHVQSIKQVHHDSAEQPSSSTCPAARWADQQRTCPPTH